MRPSPQASFANEDLTFENLTFQGKKEKNEFNKKKQMKFDFIYFF